MYMPWVHQWQTLLDGRIWGRWRTWSMYMYVNWYCLQHNVSYETSMAPYGFYSICYNLCKHTFKMSFLVWSKHTHIAQLHKSHRQLCTDWIKQEWTVIIVLLCWKPIKKQSALNKRQTWWCLLCFCFDTYK